MDPDPDHKHFFKIIAFFLKKEEFSNYFSSSFSLVFMFKIDETFRHNGYFNNLDLFKSSDFVF